MKFVFQLNKQLATDTHCLIDTKDLVLLLHKNATIPWIIIVPKTTQKEVFELSLDLQKIINNWYRVIELLFKNCYFIEKMNIATLGNVVPQLHIHVIGRKSDDACWPDAIWGKEYAVRKYTKDQLLKMQLNLTKLTDIEK